MNFPSRRSLLAAAALALALPFAASSVQAQAWPDKPIRIVVGFAPGGFTDVLGRLIGQKLSERLGQPVVVENKPGAAGTLGADQVAKAKPDGYTLLLAHSNSNSVAPALYPKLPYNILSDFTPIIPVANTPLLLTVHPSVAAKDVKEFVALAKAKPGALRYASSGGGSAQHLAAERFQLATGTQMTHIPYKGSGQAIVDLLSGQVELNFESPPNVMTHAKAGKLRLLAITSNKRSALLPDVPTMAEAGVKNAEMLQWFAVMGPAKMPADITRRLNTEIAAILKMPEVAEKIASQGGEIMGGSSEDFAKFIASDSAAFARLVKEAKITLE
ncbi:Bug family tripartite tricarboxylate transporter substrate binding protein [Ramlibacter montanisoli]|uniref:Tripartite tricarboxylate transporter substrate binding protein n=1 Tax=Ramlibacter montanisoli TaxID=2732512 RepID=A0A849KCV8_9BURK|nr:tripartite tricarboxylate transporter substrate binding protein [Ramlibacter montanisoli]NNU44334.1 tripartite tricarboxylate transporter substrate binding protein [Ramlibacter montanisoli]